MDDFERAFAGTEAAAGAAVRSAADLGKLAKALEKAAREGNITAIKRAQDKFGDALRAMEQAAGAAAQSWPLEDEEELQYLRDGYAAELRRAAAERGLNIFERDGRLIAPPSIVRILPGERAVRIDRKQSSTLRPSYLADLLVQNQKRPAPYRAERLLEAVYDVYGELVRENAADRLVKGSPGRVVPLTRIYGMLTSLPGSDREYTRTDFARDLYLLETGGPGTTRSGAVVSFHASTGARSTRATDLFTFVDAEGRDVQYYGIQFTEAG